MGDSDSKPVKLTLKGDRYTWTDRAGFMDEYFLEPSHDVQRELHPLLEEALREHDEAMTDPHDLMLAASWAREHRHYARAEKLSRRALTIAPDDASAAAVLSATLRALGRPLDALEVTAPFVGSNNTAVLTTRAAALLDAGRPQGVRKLLDRAYAIGKSTGSLSGEISGVYGRLEKDFPGH